MDFVDDNIQKVQVQPEDQVYARNEDIKVYGKLVSMSTENVVADSEQIWDEALKKNQSDINSQTQSKFGEYLPLSGGKMTGTLDIDFTEGIQIIEKDLSPRNTYIGNGSIKIEQLDGDTSSVTSKTEIDSNSITTTNAQLNNITVIPKEHNDTDRRVSHVSPGIITVDDGSNSANFTPTSIELSMSNDSGDTHVTAKTINTNEVLLRQSKAHGTQNVETSITPGLIRLHQTPGGSKHVTTIQPTGISSSMFQLTDGTDQDVLLGDGSTTGELIKQISINNTIDGYRIIVKAINGYTEDTMLSGATGKVAGLMTAPDKVKLDGIENTYLHLSGGTLTGTLRLNEINSDQNGLDINNVNGIQSVDQNKVSTPEVWTTNGNSIPLNIANGIAKLDQNGNIPLENLGNLDTQIVLVVNHLPTTDIKTNKIYLIRKNETGVDNTYIEYVYINGSWEKLGEYIPSVDLSNCVKTDENSTINADVTVNGKISSTDADIVINSGKLELHEGSYGINFISGEDSSYISKTNGKANEYFATNGSIQTIPDLDAIISYMQVVRSIPVSGFSIEGTPVTGVADIPEGIYHNPNTDTFVAKSNNKYYTSWKKNPSENIADESYYGIPSDNGVKPYIGQSYGSEDTLKVASQVASDGSVILEDVELPTAQQWKKYMH